MCSPVAPGREIPIGSNSGPSRKARTATVTAVSRVQAAFLGRDEFLAAVTGCPESTQTVEEVVSSRLKAG